MGSTIKFDSAGNPELPTLILCQQNGEKINVLHKSYNIHFSDNQNYLLYGMK